VPIPVELSPRSRQRGHLKKQQASQQPEVGIHSASIHRGSVRVDLKSNNWTGRYRGHVGTVDSGVRCLSFASEQRELSEARNPCDELTRRKSSKIVNQGPPASAGGYSRPEKRGENVRALQLGGQSVESLAFRFAPVRRLRKPEAGEPRRLLVQCQSVRAACSSSEG